MPFLYNIAQISTKKFKYDNKYNIPYLSLIIAISYITLTTLS